MGFSEGAVFYIFKNVIPLRTWYNAKHNGIKTEATPSWGAISPEFLHPAHKNSFHTFRTFQHVNRPFRTADRRQWISINNQ